MRSYHLRIAKGVRIITATAVVVLDGLEKELVVFPEQQALTTKFTELETILTRLVAVVYGTTGMTTEQTATDTIPLTSTMWGRCSPERRLCHAVPISKIVTQPLHLSLTSVA